MEPIKTNESNFTYTGPTPEIGDLPCHVELDNTFSVWKLTDEERLLIAGGGNIRLGIYGMHPIPPVSLQVVPDDGPWTEVTPAKSPMAYRETVDVPPGPPSPPIPPGPRPVG